MAIKIGYQTLTWVSTYGEKNLPNTLRDIKEAGFTGVEICEPLSVTGPADELQLLLDELGLQVASVSCGVSGNPAKTDEIEDVKRRIDFASQFGVYTVMLAGGFGFGKDGDRAQGRRDLAGVAEQIAAHAGKHGMDVAFHNHLDTLVETREEMDAFFEMAPNTKLCLDTAHLAATGGDCLKAIEDYGRRIVYAHLKDYDSTIAKPGSDDYPRAFVELGEGNVGLDFAKVLDSLENHALMEWAVVELDRSRTTPLESAKKSHAFLATLGRV